MPSVAHIVDTACVSLRQFAATKVDVLTWQIRRTGITYISIVIDCIKRVPKVHCEKFTEPLKIASFELQSPSICQCPPHPFDAPSHTKTHQVSSRRLLRSSLSQLLDTSAHT